MHVCMLVPSDFDSSLEALVHDCDCQSYDTINYGKCAFAHRHGHIESSNAAFVGGSLPANARRLMRARGPDAIFGVSAGRV